MNQFHDIQDAFKGWRRERILWVVVVLVGLLLLGGWYFWAQQRPNPAPFPEESFTPTVSATPSPSEEPPFEELPFENTPSDLDINAPTDESFGIPTDEFEGQPSETPTWFVRPFTTNTATRRPVSGGGGNFFPSSTPNRYWTYVAQTSTAFSRTGTARARITNTFMAPTRGTATAAARQTSTQAAFQTSIARTPRPSQIAYSDGGNVNILPARLPDPASVTPVAVLANAVMGDWSPNGRTIVFERGGRLMLQTVDITGILTGDPTEVPGQPGGTNNQPNWSPNNRWIAFRHEEGGQSFIYRMFPDGTRAQRLTNGLTDVSNPDWSPDSARIVYISNGDIYTIAVNPVALAPAQNWLNVFAVYRRPPFAPVWPYQVDVTETAAANQTETAVAAPTETAFAQTAEAAQTQTAAVNQTQTAAVEQTQTAAADQTATAAALQTLTPPTPTATATITPFPIVPTRLTNTSEQEAWPHYSADGRSIIFARNSGASWDIFLLTPGSLPPVQPLHTGGREEMFPFWSLDPRYKYGFLAGGGAGSLDIVLVDTNGIEYPMSIADSDKRFPVWRP